MKPRSAKAKGRNWQKKVEKLIGEATGLEYGKDCPIQSREMSQTGTDIKVIGGKAKKLFPFSAECKCCEKWNLPAWIKQAQDNQLSGTDWILFLNRNKTRPGEETEVVVMSAKTFFKALAEGAFTKNETQKN